MTPRLLLRPEAEADIEEAFRWYEQRSIGLGHEYLRVVRVALAGVERTPDAYPVILDDIRRAGVRRFPYYIYYVARSRLIGRSLDGFVSGEPHRIGRPSEGE